MPEVLGDIHDVLVDILRPALRQKDFDDEKSVILEEIAMYDDQPFWVLYENALEQYYGSNSLGHRVLGTNETITKMKRDELATYFVDRYSADNTVVALAGNFQFDEMVDKINSHCGSWKRTNTKRKYTEFERFGGKIQKQLASAMKPASSTF